MTRSDSVIPSHPLADLFPMLGLVDADALRVDIAANGLRERIVILDGQILDGRNRYRAAVGAGVIFGELPPEGSDLWVSHFRRFNPAQDGDPLGFVLSKNKFRRHMSPSQLAMLAADIANLSVGRPKAAPSEDDDNIPPIGGISAEAASAMVGAKLRNTERAAQVRDHGAPELVDAVKQGEVAVSAAAELSTLPVGEQLRILREQHPREFRRAVKEHRGEVQADKKERRVEREAELGARQQALPDRRYGVIIADPEWQFKSWSEDTGMDRAPDNHYPTSPTEVIASRPVASIAADDSALLLWATAPRLPDALQVLAAWGFSYVTHIVWGKDRPGAARGPGYWFTGEHELVLLGTRGKIPAPAQGTQFRSLFHADVGAHSEKPSNVHEIAEAYFPNLPKIELNARALRPGWDAWGLEAPEAVHAVSEGIAMSFEEATPILQARYATTSGDELSRIIGRPIGTIRTWAHRLELTSAARLKGNASHLGDKLKKPRETTS